EAKGFVPNIERLLLAVDDSANGQFATRIGGMIAGHRGSPTTVMHIKNDKKTGKAAAEAEKAQAKAAGETMREIARQTREAEVADSPEDKQPEKTLDITTRLEKSPEPEAIAEEAEKGYDLLVIGVENTTVRQSDFHENVANLALSFEGPLAVVEARDLHRDDPLHGRLNILVPVNGTEPSRRGAEVAVVLARASKARLTAIYVTPASARNKRPAQHEEAILADIAALAKAYGLELRTAIRSDMAADQAILKEMSRRRSTLLVMGVGRRSGDKLFFGDTAAALLEKSRKSLLFVAS
ncbi:MAG TPA: universal stress protein, partial [Pseudolabrys sp.]|nr:universal stress protein [Pseudolabrys sp.]